MFTTGRLGSGPAGQLFCRRNGQLLNRRDILARQPFVVQPVELRRGEHDDERESSVEADGNPDT